MSASILSFTRRRSRSRQNNAPIDWSTQELAELYRICERLGQAGLKVSLCRGITDEGDPWVIFERDETLEVIIHIGRVDGYTFVINIATKQVYRGVDFRAITNRMLRDVPFASLHHGSDDKVVFHPNSVFTAFVAAAILVTEFTRNIEPAHAGQKSDEIAPEAHNSLSHLMSRLLARDHMLVVQNMNNPMIAVGTLSAALFAMDLVIENRASKSIHDDHFLVSEPRSVVANAPSVNYLETANAGRHSNNLHLSDGGNVFVRTVVDEGSETAFHFHKATVDATPLSKTPTQGTKGDLPIQGKNAEDHHEASASIPSALELYSAAQQHVPLQEAPPAPEPASDANEVSSLADHSSQSLSAVSVLMPKQIAGSIVVTDLHGTDDIAGLKQALTTFFDDKLEIRAAGSFSDQSSRDNSSAAGQNSDADSNKAHGGSPGSSPAFAFHGTSGQDGITVLSDDQVDVVVYEGHDASFSHFELGGDFILVDGSFSRTEWIAQIEVKGSDVFIVGVDGGTISLYDSYHQMA